jgi:glucokinase
VLRRIASGIEPLLGAHPDVASIGLGLPGVVNDRGDVSYPPNFRGWEVVAVEQELRPILRTDLPIAVENDANVAALAEAHAGSGREHRHFLFITLGTGVGGCIIHDGAIWRGATGGAGEIGHVSVDFNGRPCNCGSRGCIEAYIGHRYMSTLALERLGDSRSSSLRSLADSGRELEPKLINEAAESGDSFAREFLADMGDMLGAAIASAMNLCDLHLAIVGGGTSRAGQYLIEPARRSLRARVLRSIADADLRVAHLSNDAGIIGAALLGLGSVGARNTTGPGTRDQGPGKK